MRTLIEKPPKYVLLVALSVATLRSTPCQGHDGPVHQKITASAAALSDGLSSFLGQNNASLNSPRGLCTSCLLPPSPQSRTSAFKVRVSTGCRCTA